VKTNRFEFLKILLCLLLVACMVLPPVPAQAQKTYRDSTVGFISVPVYINCSACTASASNITPIDVGAYASGVIIVNVSAVSGTTPSLTVNFQICDGNASAAPSNANCVTHTAGSAITATGLQVIKVDHFSRWTTLNYTISGTTPSFTFTATGYFKPTS
jgi:hypothetical protein